MRKKTEVMTKERILRKIDQAYEMAGLARQDRDFEDEKKHFAEARRLEQLLRETS